MSTDFEKIEEDAKKAFEMKDKPAKPLSEEEAGQYIENIKDLSKQQKQEQESKIKTLDPQKAEQMERLGMGLRETNNKTSARSGGISHSAISDFLTIEQTNPTSKPSASSVIDRIDSRPSRDLDKTLMMLELGVSSRKDPDDFWETLNAKPSRSSEIVDSFPSFDSDNDRRSKPRREKEAPSRSRNFEPTSSASDEAQKKFGAAKSISSTQYFGNETTPDFEERARLHKFQGASSLSSDEYFGRNTGPQSSASAMAGGGANLYDIKESVRDAVKDGVTKVAGRLSDVMSSLQEKYSY